MSKKKRVPVVIPERITLPSPGEIEAGKSPRGGFTRATLAGWGVPWPPPKGWRETLVKRWEAESDHSPGGGDGISWPIIVTVPDGEGGIKALSFASREEADRAGFEWIGRPGEAACCTMMIRIDAPHFVGGVILDADGRVVRAAPILGWTVGKSADEVRAYCKRRGWIVEDIEG